MLPPSVGHNGMSQPSYSDGMCWTRVSHKHTPTVPMSGPVRRKEDYCQCTREVAGTKGGVVHAGQSWSSCTPAGSAHAHFVCTFSLQRERVSDRVLVSAYRDCIRSASVTGVLVSAYRHCRVQCMHAAILQANRKHADQGKIIKPLQQVLTQIAKDLSLSLQIWSS